MMKLKNVAAVTAAVAAMATMATSVSAADWSQVSYADNDATTGQIVSYDANGFVFANTDANPDLCKARITLEKVLKNPKDFDKVRKLTWTVTYNNVPKDFEGDALSGGTYVTCTNANGYHIECPEWDGDNPVWTESTYIIEDFCELSDDLTLVEDGELVFMDWSYSNLGDYGITVSITDFKMFDKDGKEIEQLGLNEFGKEVVEEAEPVIEEQPEVEAEPEKEQEPVKDETPKTGNSVLPIMAAVAATAVSAVALSKKSK